MTDIIAGAWVIARLAHQGQTYGPDEADYFEAHVESVVSEVLRVGGDDEAIALAYLHDTLEDTPLEARDLSDFSAAFRPILPSLLLLTRTPGVPYSEYIEALSKDHRARLVKMADLRCNVRAKPTASLQRRYTKAYATLKAAHVRALTEAYGGRA